MAINFSSFVGGLATAGSQFIDEKRATDAASVLTKEARQWQIATEARADTRARTLKREERQRVTEEYIGSMVADLHRNMIKGGIFIYPETTKAPAGKLRLQYECNPMAFLMEQAGGIASTGSQRIMEVEPTKLHQRVPAIMGSEEMVEKLLSFYK